MIWNYFNYKNESKKLLIRIFFSIQNDKTFERLDGFYRSGKDFEDSKIGRNSHFKIQKLYFGVFFHHHNVSLRGSNLIIMYFSTVRLSGYVFIVTIPFRVTMLFYDFKVSVRKTFFLTFCDLLSWFIQPNNCPYTTCVFIEKISF